MCVFVNKSEISFMAGGTLFLEALDYWYGLQISGIVCIGRVSFSRGLGRMHGCLAAETLEIASSAMGLWEISTGLAELSFCRAILGTGGFLTFWRLDFAPSVALRSSQPT